MKRLALLALLIWTAFLLTACPVTPPPPNPAECPVGPQAAPQALEPLRLQGMGKFEGDYVPGEVLAIPAPGLSLQALKAQVAGVEPQEELSWGLVRLKVPVGQEEAKARALLKAGMRYVQPNYIYKPLKVPNDTYYYLDQRIYLNNLVGLEAAWDSSTGRGCPPLVAVLDTGVQKDHPDLAASLWLPRGWELDVADGDSDPSDRDGHGTGVVGVLGAQTDNRQGIAGVTWGGYILPIKVFGDNGDGSSWTVLQGVRLARQLGARIVNLSLCLMSGGECASSDSDQPYDDPTLTSEIRQGRAEGIVFVGASGNYNQPVVGYPASLPEVIAVGAVTNSKTRASFSNYGVSLDLVAPGGGPVWMTRLGGDYVSNRGTSFSSPIVAGVVALYMSKYASERKAWPTPDQVYTCLTGNAEDLGASGRDDYYGFGLVRADRVMTDPTYCFP
jgi:serine protease